MSALAAITRSVYEVLARSSVLVALIADNVIDTGSPTVPAIYTDVPQPSAPEDDDAFPYIAMGDFTSAEFDTDDLNGQDHTLAIHVWDRGTSSLRSKQVMDAVYNALHRVQLEPSGQHAIFCFWEYSESVPDPDVLVQHGVVRFRIVTQEH